MGALSLVLLSLPTLVAKAQSSINLSVEGNTNYVIVVPSKPSTVEDKAANVLKGYLKEISGADFKIINDLEESSDFELLIGSTNRNFKKTNHLKDDGFVVVSSKSKIQISGNGKGTLYGVYAFLETYLGCRKFAANMKVVPKNESIRLGKLDKVEQPHFEYRTVYFKDVEEDQEYLDWYRLHRIEDKWGLWGHTFHKLVPSDEYFSSHPEYFALINGQRNPAQLCMSNDKVVEIVVAKLAQLMEDQPEAKFWSVSQNDGAGYCTCEKCTTLNTINESPQGSLLTFVNKVASHFPDKTISTLAYAWSRKPPKAVSPAKNVNILLSNIEVNRSAPIAVDPRSQSFRKEAADWQKLTSNIIIWDYVTQFTNYISPFPNMATLKPNMLYFKKTFPVGVFIQGPIETNAEFSELRAYLLAKLSWNTQVDEEQIRNEFLNAFYGEAAPYIQEYISLITQQVSSFKKRLNIYDNPIIPHRSFLSPVLLEKYADILEKGLASVDAKSQYYKNVKLIQMSVLFAQLQQARYYGTNKHGVFVKTDGRWHADNKVTSQLNTFFEAADLLSIKQLNEEGLTLEQYKREWNKLLDDGPDIHKAYNKEIKLLTEIGGDFVGKGANTLTDGNKGNLDFQYNWLMWDGNDVEVLLDLGEDTDIQHVSTNFLYNVRHQMYLPKEIQLDLSADGQKFTNVGTIINTPPNEEDEKQIKNFSFDFGNARVRYIKLKATNLKELPEWVLDKKRKPLLLIDEIVVN